MLFHVVSKFLKSLYTSIQLRKICLILKPVYVIVRVWWTVLQYLLSSLLFVLKNVVKSVSKLVNVCLFVVSAVRFAPYLTGLSSMMLIWAAGARCMWRAHLHNRMLWQRLEPQTFSSLGKQSTTELSLVITLIIESNNWW